MVVVAVVPLIDCGRVVCMANGVAMKLKREAVRKSVEWGGIKMREELTVTAFFMRHTRGV